MKKLFPLLLITLLISCVEQKKENIAKVVSEEQSLVGTVWTYQREAFGHKLRDSFVFYDNDDVDFIFSGGGNPSVVYNSKYEVKDNIIYISTTEATETWGEAGAVYGELSINNDIMSLTIKGNDTKSEYKKVK